MACLKDSSVTINYHEFHNKKKKEESKDETSETIVYTEFILSIFLYLGFSVAVNWLLSLPCQTIKRQFST